MCGASQYVCNVHTCTVNLLPDVDIGKPSWGEILSDWKTELDDMYR